MSLAMRILQALLVIIILGLQVRLWVGPGSIAEIQRLEEAIATQEEENRTLEQCNQALIIEVEELKNGTDAIEEMARHDLGLIGEGETFFMILDDNERESKDSEDAFSTNSQCE